VKQKTNGNTEYYLDCVRTVTLEGGAAGYSGFVERNAQRP
jgi:hypothetical protein